jgi:flagellar assembly protein FliH
VNSPRGTVLRGEIGVQILPARIDCDLRDNPYAKGTGTDPRLVDPTLVRAFDELAVEVREHAQQEGFDAGYADGLLQGRAEAEQALAAERAADQERLRERIEELIGARDVLLSAAARLESRQTAALADVEEMVLRAAYDVAEAIVGRELKLAADPVRDAVSRAMSLVPIEAAVVLRLHPEDAALLDLTAEWTRGQEVHVVADRSLERGDCIADAGPTRVDARIAAALNRVREVLAP